MNELSNEELKKLNKYLNEVAIYFYYEYPEILSNLKSINYIAIRFYDKLDEYKINKPTKTNNLTFEDVYLLSREIIESIDPKYLNDFDNLIKSGELEFKYEENFEDGNYKYGMNGSVFSYSNVEKYKLIDIDRQYNYNDVKILIHEYIHYLNTEIGNYNEKNKNLLTEFLAIYFETYAGEYLIKKDINIDEINYMDRLCSAKNKSDSLILSSLVLLVYDSFGDINSETYKDIEKLDLPIKVSKEKFNYCLKQMYNYFEKIDKKITNSSVVYTNYALRHRQLSDSIFQDVIYTICTLLAFYAMTFNDMEDIIWLNDNVGKYSGNVFELLGEVDIKLDEDFIDKAFTSVEKYMKKYGISKVNK